MIIVWILAIAALLAGVFSLLRWRSAGAALPEEAPTVSIIDTAEPAGPHAELHARYLEAARALGLDRSDIDAELFAKRLEVAARAIEAKHGRAVVGFEVRVRDGEIALAPTFAADDDARR